MALPTYSFQFSVACPANSTPYLAKYSNDESGICSDVEKVVFISSSSSIGTGVTVYTDAGLTVPLVGYSFFTETVSGTIWNINNSTGVIGTSTGNSC